KVPILLKLRPGGSPPALTAHPLYGVMPPLAANTWENGTPTAPAGNCDAVMMERDPAFGISTANVTALEVVPPGLSTVTLAVPWLALGPAGTDDVNCVPLTYLVDSADPLHCTVDPER